MNKVIWSDESLDQGDITPEAGGLDAARGLIIGLAISQIFWLTLALILIR